MNRYLLLLLVIAGLAAGCSSSANDTNNQPPTGKELAQKFIIVDGHIDVPYRLNNHWEDISKEAGGDFDYPRAKEGGLDAPFMSIYIPTSYQKTGGAKALADSLIDMVKGIAADHPDKFAIATSPEEIKQQFEKGLISLPMGMENGAPIGTDLSNVKYFYDRGIRYITLTHGKDNEIGDSSYDTTEDRHNGLSDFGKKVVKEMNRVGIMVDVSHISDKTFYDVMEVSEAPAIASHSSARHFTPGFERNMDDAMIKELANNDGVIMVNFGSNFLDTDSRSSSDGLRDRIAQKIEEEGLDAGSEEARKLYNQLYDEEYHFSNVSKVADHIDHIVDLVGIDYVGLGSDYDGVGNTLPEGLKDASEYPNLFDELLERGYSEEDIQKIASGNVFRVWNEVEKKAEEVAQK